MMKYYFSSLTPERENSFIIFCGRNVFLWNAHGRPGCLIRKFKKPSMVVCVDTDVVSDQTYRYRSIFSLDINIG